MPKGRPTAVQSDVPYSMTDRFNWRAAILAAGTLALLALFAVGVETVVILRHLDQDRAAARQSLSGTTDLLRHRIEAVTYSLDRATGKFGDIEQDIKEEAKAREKYDAKATALLDQTQADLVKFGQATDQLNALLANTNTQVNGNLVPALTTQVNAMGKTIAALTDDVMYLRIALDSANKVITDVGPPMQAAAEHTASSMAHVDATTFDIQQYVHRITRPGKAVWGIIKEAMGIGSSTGNIKRGLF